MTRRDLPIVGPYYVIGDWSVQDTLNYLPVKTAQAGARTAYELRQAPGPKPFVRIYTQAPGEDPVYAGPIRGMRNVEGKLLVVAGTRLFEVTPARVCIPRGTIPGVDRVSLSHIQKGLGNQVSIDNGVARYVYDTVALTLTKVTDEAFPGSIVSFEIDGYSGFVEKSGRYWGHSQLGDALDYSSFDRSEAEGDPDRIVTARVSHREVLIFGTDTIEPYINTGEAEGTFQRASNTVIECGCSAKYAVSNMDNSVFWPDDKYIVRRLNGYTPARVSDDAIEEALAGCTPAQIARAFSFTWEDRGHKVYYFTVPGMFTFGYDLLSGLWHRRSSGSLATWRFADLVFWNGLWIGGDVQTGDLLTLDWNYFYDGRDDLVRERVSGFLSDNQNPVTVNSIELVFGVGGPVCELADYPEQPEGPSITGAAPDGERGVAYAGYTYTLTGGTPPYTVTVREGETPAGLSISAQGVIDTGTPTEIASDTFTLRVTDANGLWAEIEDTIDILYDFRWDSDPAEYIAVADGAGVAEFQDADMTIYAAYSSGVEAQIRAQSTHSISGKRNFEFELEMNNDTAAGAFYIGIHAVSQVGWPSAPTWYVILAPQQPDGTGDVYVNAGGTNFPVPALAWSSTDHGTCRMRMAVDADARLVWFGVDPSGEFENGDPATGTGGSTPADSLDFWLYGEIRNITTAKQRRITIVEPADWMWEPPEGFT